MALKVGSNGPDVLAWQQLMNRRFASYSRETDGSPLRTDGYFGLSDRDVASEWQRRTDRPVTGEVSDEELQLLGLGATPAPAPDRHACLTLRGTGGVVGQDLTSLVAQACSGLVEEIPVDNPASMGGIPVGAASDQDAPSGQKCVDLAVEWVAEWIEAHPNRTFVLGSYSLLAVAASQVRAMLAPGGRLADYADNYVCGFTFGNPSRAFGHTYYLGAIPAGEGMSDFHLPQALATWDWCDLANPDDIYTNVPTDQTGEIMRQAYKIVMGTQVSDPLGTVQKILPHIFAILQDAGVNLPFVNLPGVLSGLVLGLIASALPNPNDHGMNNDTAAAVRAASLGIAFATANPPTAPHIEYHIREVWPGQTYLGLAIQHVTQWAAQHPVRL
jgi:hypothetical protein